MKKNYFFYFILFFIFTFTIKVYAEVSLSNYEAKFEVVPNSSGEFEDILVTLKITYKVLNETKSEGYKFVGKEKIKNISVRSERGEIPFRVEELVENKISYNFSPIFSGEKTIFINFIIVGAIKDKILHNEISFDWIGNWKFPVEKSKYIFIFPENYSYKKIETNFLSFKEELIDGKKAVLFEQIPLTIRNLNLKFSPKLSNVSYTAFYLICLIVSLYLIFYGIIRYSKLPSSSLVDTREPTPAEVAYLKRGRIHSICVAIFDLIQRGFITKVGEDMLQCSRREGNLVPYELIIQGFFRNPKTLKDFFQSSESKKSFDDAIVNSLSRKGCLKEINAEKSLGYGMIRNSIFGLVIILALGYSLDVFKQSPAPFSLFFSIIVCVTSLIIGLILLKSHPHSNRGHEILLKYENLAKDYEKFITHSSTYEPSLSYAVAILGVGVLLGTIYNDYLSIISYSQAFHPGTSTACSSCSTGFSGDGGSGGCSGCGGCGGCGG